MTQEQASPLITSEQADQMIKLRPDLRPPGINFGHCTITGEWGLCLTIDIGSYSVPIPDPEQEPTFNPATNEIDIPFKDQIVEQQLTISKRGLALLQQYANNIPDSFQTPTKELVYAWEMVYKGGESVKQYLEDGSETLFKDIDQEKVVWVLLKPRFDASLPKYSLNVINGQIFKEHKGVTETLEIPNAPEHKEGYPFIYTRRNMLIFGSSTPTLDRNFTLGSKTVKQILGWGESSNPLNDGIKCMIAIDDFGNWMPIDKP